MIEPLASSGYARDDRTASKLWECRRSEKVTGGSFSPALLCSLNQAGGHHLLRQILLPATGCKRRECASLKGVRVRAKITTEHWLSGQFFT